MRCPKSSFPIRIIVFDELKLIIFVSQGLTLSTASLVIIIIIIIIILFWDLGTLYFPVLIFPFPYLFPILVPSPSRLTIAGMGPGSKIFFNFCDFFLDGPTLGHISGHM